MSIGAGHSPRERRLKSLRLRFAGDTDKWLSANDGDAIQYFHAFAAVPNLDALAWHVMRAVAKGADWRVAGLAGNPITNTTRGG
jgi:hypothetical protein